MRRRGWALAAGGALLAVLVLTQLLLPGLVASRIEARLTEQGGSASAEARAVPALRLLFGDGAELEIRGEGLRFDLDEEPSGVFERLDGFGEVDVELRRLTAGPLAIESFTLGRSGDGPYAMLATATTTVDALIDFGSARLGLAGALFEDDLRDAAEAALDPDRRIPLALDMTLESEGGELEVVAGGGTVFGFPTGPLGALVAEAVVARI